MPAIGALKPAEIAAATPQPINTSLLKLSFAKKLENMTPIVPPRCTIGPYWPREAPPARDMNDAKTEKKLCLLFKLTF